MPAGFHVPIHVHFVYSSQTRTRSIRIPLPDLPSDMMLRRSGRVRKPPRWLLLSSVPVEPQDQANSQNTRASENRQELAMQDQGSDSRYSRDRSQSAERFVEHGNEYVQQQAIIHTASRSPSNAESHPVTVISQIEAIFESIAVDIQQGRELTIPYCRVRGTRDINSRLRFPGRSVSEARSFGKIPLPTPGKRQITFLRAVFKLSYFCSPGTVHSGDVTPGSHKWQYCNKKVC